MKLHQLRALDAVARLGGIRAAAREMHLSQPALTKALRELEGATGLKLLDRGNAGAILTEAGSRLLLRSRVVFRELEYAEMEMRQMAGQERGRVSVALSPVLGQLILSKAYRTFNRQFPNISLRVEPAFTRTSLAAVADGRVDFAVVLLQGVHAAANVVVEPWFDVAHRVLGRAGHPLGQRATLDQVLSQDWALTNATAGGQFDLLAKLCADNGHALPEVIHEAASTTLLVALVSGTELLTFAPMLNAATLNSGETQIIECEEVRGLTRKFGLLRRADSYLSPAANALKDEIMRLSLDHVSRMPPVP
ncbi:LysR family transcriptional regulator [Ketogulonicigenium vulgare]|uniref:LysR family transcriptional regulator n=1 Tax=Ketogulonicigenium vulgare (strain WSH-001) TaxID=759362 RepID=F9Y611_KETVW|nr:LysR family transcriptional regulator [Ketogulonicigenium vulgare]ADO42644.1 transcriptional regulatory protein [Ketogulonicigenium vulgare Y25]AEM40836.1 LysR family transcriptional regulator [Ketogulonicigenium vulgare WSH-001]ALJ81000.1 LysR family transcriptional regulator [Ketogulonicigenium vulgare]ANW33766.1 LysR family transcriptional regulator [Ketogulonicigenium vulgare]AOZ54554.1 transcriptional regulatory protein [Ketogulonicigenium vulgare]